ncbi:MAG: DUF262 domain-containing protein [Hydrogenophaga sp.]|uniref:DUF262 domain-containing protein n=1 Tax=Hydrogenophaga sp. TaxID=1904254 RepID=UPI00271B135B|nr:DUF262 domain-containing protein [Hydrogenophaga sp.]MDO9031364.1 DUF262 domain-containing protein [Hydrogenophaga sp.]
MEVTTDRRTVQQCLEQRYALPTYQRDYKWETKHLRELLEDIQDVFFSEFDSKDSRTAVSKYEKYFLGTIITIPAEEGRRAIVDGQQRITTLALIIAHFQRLSATRPELNISDLNSLLRKKLFGASQYNIQFSPARAQLFDLLCDADVAGPDLDDRIDAIPELDDSGRRMYAVFLQIHAYLSDDLVDATVPYFVDYLTQCVSLFEIGVPSEQSGHKVFVTMNDRGLKLSPLDLLKGYLLSNITDDSHNTAAHLKWKSMLDSLQAQGADEDTSFFKNWLRAQHADSIRSKQKDAPLGDFELAADTYHRWVEENGEKIGLRNSDDYHKLITVTLPYFQAQYVKCLACEGSFDSEYAAVYFNGSRDLTLQSMVVLAALDPSDSTAVAKVKMRLASHFLDCYSIHRFLNNQDNTYNNLRDPLFDLAKKIRRKSVPELRRIFEAAYDTAFATPLLLGNLTYSSDSAMVLHILARFAHFLEESLSLTNRVQFHAYVQRKKSNSTFDIEHLLPLDSAISRAELGADYDFTSDDDYKTARNSIGGLILLSRGRNRSLKAKPFGEKRQAYATEGVLAQTFCDSFYTNNPQVREHIARIGLPLEPKAHVNKAVIAQQSAIYSQIAGLIWSKAHFATIEAELATASLAPGL